MWLKDFFFVFSLTHMWATAMIVPSEWRRGNQSTLAALGQTCCYATEHFGRQGYQKWNMLAIWKRKKKGSYCWVIAGGSLCNLCTVKLWVTLGLIANIYIEYNPGQGLPTKSYESHDPTVSSILPCKGFHLESLFPWWQLLSTQWEGKSAGLWQIGLATHGEQG